MTDCLRNICHIQLSNTDLWSLFIRIALVPLMHDFDQKLGHKMKAIYVSRKLTLFIP